MEFSSPYADGESREDKLYSPYSAYGNGDAAAYNGRRGGKEEIAFWTEQLKQCVARVDKIPGHVQKKSWSDVATELTSRSYNLREAMLRLANSSKNPDAATASARAYFSDLDEIFEFALKKKGDVILGAYERSKSDFFQFKSYL